MAAAFEIYHDDDGLFRFELAAANGEVLAYSDGYETAEGARRGVEAVRRAVPEATVPAENGLVSMRHRDGPPQA